MENEYPAGASLDDARRRFDALVRRGVFRPVERFVCRDRDADDRMAEGIGACWAWYAREAALGHEPDVALCVHVVRLRALDRSRSVVPRGRRPALDAYDAAGRPSCRVEMRRLDEVRDDDEDQERREDPSLGIARIGVANPEPNIASALDLSSWLDALASADRQMIEMRGAGFKLAEISKTTGRSVASVFRTTRRLGLDLAERAGVEVLTLGGGRFASAPADT